MKYYSLEGENYRAVPNPPLFHAKCFFLTDTQGFIPRLRD
jgi:hypothetical protein